MKIRPLLLFISFFVLTSCLTTQEVRYIQPNENLVINEEGLIPHDVPAYRITKHDLLKLNIITTPKGDAAQFYSSLHASQGGSAGGGDFYFSGLKLDEAGFVDVFGVGKIKAEGKTTNELAAEIQGYVNENFLPGKSEVRVSLEGIKYYFLSDVDGKSAEKIAKTPTINLFEAIAESGGLDRAIDRKNVVILRKYPEGTKKAVVDLTREDIMNSQFFWIQNGDMIMFNTKPKSFYGFGKEPLQTLTTGVSLLTTALSIYLLITRL